MWKIQASSGFDMYQHLGVLKALLKLLLDAVAQVVRGPDGHLSGEGEMKVDDPGLSRFPGPEVMEAGGFAAVLLDDLDHYAQVFLGQGRVHQGSKGVVQHLPGFPQDKQGHDDGDYGI